MSEIDTARIAEILGYSQRYVTERIVKRPDFPAPKIATSRQNKWWAEDEVRAWANPASRQSPQA